MRRLPIAVSLLVLGLLSAFGATAQTDGTTPADGSTPIEGTAPTAPADQGGERRIVDVIELTGLVDPPLTDFLTKSLAASGDAVALVIQVNSGGSVLSDEDFDALVDAVADAPAPVGIWVGPSGARAGGGLEPLLGAADVVGVSPGSTVTATVGTSVVGGGEPRAPARLGPRDAIDEQVADLDSPTLGDFIVDLDGRTVDGVVLDTADVVETDDGPRLEPTVQVRFSKPTAVARLLHTVASPSVAYLLLVVGVALLLFELFTGGIGVAGLTGAVCLLLAGYGLAVLPTNSWALVAIAVAAFGFGVDIQTGVPRVWTGIAVVSFVVGSVFLFDGVSPSWLALLAGIVAMPLLAVGAAPSVARSRYGTPTIGREWMVGELVDVEAAVDPEGVVVVRGARWRARANRATPVPAGERARVVEIEGVVLVVEPEEGGARDYRERARRGSDA